MGLWVELVEWEVGLVGKGFRLKFLNYRIIRLTGVKGKGAGLTIV